MSIQQKHGYIDAAGHYIISPQLDYAFFFSEGLAAVEIYDRWGYIDATGQYIIPPQFNNASFFSEGLAAVKINDRWGYIDRTRQYIISPQFDEAEDFSDGLARVKIKRKWGYIDKTGQCIITPQFDEAENFSDGLARVKIKRKWGYIDEIGQCIIIPQFNEAGDFSDGLALVKIDDKWGCIDKAGQDIISPQFDEARNFSNGLALVKIDDKWGCIDKAGQDIISPQFDDIWWCFSENLVQVKIDDKWGYIDTIGQDIIFPRFDEAGCFSEGLAWVKINDKWGCINKTGQYIIPHKFDKAGYFSDGLSRVEINEKSGYIDRTGQYIIPPQFDEAEDFYRHDEECPRIAIVGINKYEWDLDLMYYQADKKPRFGDRNPEEMAAPFWREMVKFRLEYCDPDHPRYQNQESEFPIWGFDRAGRSLNLLPDGRFIEIGGYQGGYYDENFYIYNDVVVYDKQGDFQIYGYPRDVFPPTDYHTATWVDGWIYIIGNVSYIEDRIVGETSVYRLNCTTFEIEPVITTGECPGWISKHTAVVRDRQIHISGGKINVIEQDKPTYIDNQTEYILDLDECCWYREESLTKYSRNLYSSPSQTHR